MDAFDTAMVGTCNGLLCLCDNTVPGGGISLLNPVTGESLALPTLPGSKQWVWWGNMLLPVSSGWHQAYSFAYDPMAEVYKVVHLPCYLDRSGGFNTLQVFALGKNKRWRDELLPGRRRGERGRGDALAHQGHRARRVVRRQGGARHVHQAVAGESQAWVRVAPGRGGRTAGPLLVQRPMGDVLVQRPMGDAGEDRRLGPSRR